MRYYGGLSDKQPNKDNVLVGAIERWWFYIRRYFGYNYREVYFMRCAGIGNKHKDGNMQCGNCGYRPRNYFDEHFYRSRGSGKFSMHNQDATEDLVLSVLFALLILGVIAKVIFYVAG